MGAALPSIGLTWRSKGIALSLSATLPVSEPDE
jgi:hypothetical protein